MDVVYQEESLSMEWCLDCHRAPENHLRPLDKVTDLGWAPPQNVERTGGTASGVNGRRLASEAGQETFGRKGPERRWANSSKHKRGVHPPDSNCSGCHR